MVRPVLQFAVICILITVYALAHLAANFLVSEGVGLPALVIFLLSTPWLSRYLD